MENPVRQKEQITFKYIGGIEDRSGEKTSISHYTYKGYSVVKISVQDARLLRCNNYCWGYIKKDGFHVGGSSTKKSVISNLDYMDKKRKIK